MSRLDHPRGARRRPPAALGGAARPSRPGPAACAPLRSAGRPPPSVGAMTPGRLHACRHDRGRQPLRVRFALPALGHVAGGRRASPAHPGLVGARPACRGGAGARRPAHPPRHRPAHQLRAAAAARSRAACHQPAPRARPGSPGPAAGRATRPGPLAPPAAPPARGRRQRASRRTVDGRAVVAAAPETDVFHAQSLIVLPVVRAAARRLGGRFVYDVADYHTEAARLARMPWLVREVVRRRERDWARDASGFLAVSDPVADLVVASAGACRDRRCCGTARRRGARTSPSPCASDRIRAATGIEPDRPIVLYQGGFSVDRGVEELIAAATSPRLMELGAAVVFMGYGRLETTIADAVAAHPGRIYLLPAVRPDDLLPWTASADVCFVGQPPRTLNQRLNLPNKLFEIIMAGVPGRRQRGQRAVPPDDGRGRRRLRRHRRPGGHRGGLRGPALGAARRATRAACPLPLRGPRALHVGAHLGRRPRGALPPARPRGPRGPRGVAMRRLRRVCRVPPGRGSADAADRRAPWASSAWPSCSWRACWWSRWRPPATAATAPW